MSKTETDRKCLNPTCPCQDGDSCHYESVGDTKAWPIPKEYMIPGCIYEQRTESRQMNPEDFNAEDFDPGEMIEGEEGLASVAKMGLTVFRALIRDGATWNEAFSVTGAFFAGSMKAVMEDNSDEEDE